MMPENKIICGAMPVATKVFPDGHFNCSISSPPYWALRDYSACDCTIDVLNPARTTAGPIKCTGGRQPNPNCPKCGGTGKNIEVEKNQLGLEPTFEEYIDKLCTIYDEVKRVLRDDGTCWVNLGDTYNNAAPGARDASRWPKQSRNDHTPNKRPPATIQTKSLCLIPQRFAIEMVNRGWILRNVIIWHKPNPMPSSAKDRFTVDFEYVYFFVKSKKYWFEPQYEPYLTESNAERPRMGQGTQTKYNQKRGYGGGGSSFQGHSGTLKADGTQIQSNPFGRNKRTVWTIPTQPFPEAHFATFPEKLVEPMIKAGCPEFVCTKCGKAREKIYETTYHKHRKNPQVYREHSNYISTLKVPCTKINKPIGYTDCGCNADWRPGIVLDCFCWLWDDFTGSCKATA